MVSLSAIKFNLALIFILQMGGKLKKKNEVDSLILKATGDKLLTHNLSFTGL